MRASLRWEEQWALLPWMRAVAYYGVAMVGWARPAVQALAHERLRRLLDAAQRGLDRRR